MEEGLVGLLRPKEQSWEEVVRLTVVVEDLPLVSKWSTIGMGWKAVQAGPEERACGRRHLHSGIHDG